MQGEGLLIGIAQLAIVVAGFTAISTTLLPAGATWTPAQRIRLRAIVSTSFNVAFESLVPPILFPALGDQRSTVMVASAIVAIYAWVVISVRARQLVRAHALAARSVQLTVATGIGATVLFTLDAAVLGSVTVFAVALCLQLSVAAINFYAIVSNTTS